MQSFGYAAHHVKAPLAPFTFERRDPGPRDVVVEIEYCGVCHSDLHQLRDEWGNSTFPMVPGHEIVGRVTSVGKEVERFRPGDAAGVGVLVDSCRVCASCTAGEEQYCEKGLTPTYNGVDHDGRTTYGGYSNNIVVDERYTHTLSPRLHLPAVAPLLCAGITTYSPLRHWKVGKGAKVGVVGLGGLGHMALKFAHAFGAHVVQFTTSLSKTEDARRLGADEVVLSNDRNAMQKHARSFDFIVDTVSAPHDLDPYFASLRRDGILTLVGLPQTPSPLRADVLTSRRISVAGSMVGGMPETQEMLDFCAEHNIVADVEVIAMEQIEEAYERMLKNDVKYRFVIDLATLRR